MEVSREIKQSLTLNLNLRGFNKSIKQWHALIAIGRKDTGKLWIIMMIRPSFVPQINPTDYRATTELQLLLQAKEEQEQRGGHGCQAQQP